MTGNAAVEPETDGTDPSGLPLPPGPDGYPLVGSTIGLMRDPYRFYDTVSGYGDVVGYSAFGVQFAGVIRPEYVEQVLLADHDQFEKWDAMDVADLHFAPEGLVFTEGEQWRRQRTVVQDAFTIDRIRGYADTMRRVAEETVEGWADGEEIALNEAFSELTLRVLVRSLFELEVEEDVDLLQGAMAAVNDRADGSKLSNLAPGWVPTRTNRRYKRAVREMQEFVDGLIDERRGRADEYDDLLSLLLTATDEEGRGLSETEVRDQMITFLGAGTETTALALTYAFLELSQHDDARATLDAEHESVLGADPPTLADLGDLTYTEQVIDEAMRLYPPAYITFREASEDVALGGYRIPQGTKVVLPQYHVHTDERWYDGPDQFRPDRWTEEFREQLHDYAFFPFGGGPRHCIGMRFAMMELKCVLSTVAQRVEFELLSDPDPEFSLGVTLRPKNDVRVRVHER